MRDARRSPHAHHPRHRRRRAAGREGAGRRAPHDGRTDVVRTGAPGPDAGSRQAGPKRRAGAAAKASRASAADDETRQRVEGRVKAASLLDVNVLVALFDPDHVHHELAHDWFADHGRHAWATCAITENGFLRVLTNPAYGATVGRVSDLAERFSRFRATEGHVFWEDSLSLLDAGRF